MPDVNAKKQEPYWKFKERSCLHAQEYFSGNYFLVWHVLDSERMKWGTKCYVIHLFVFLSKKGRWYHFGLFSLIMIDAHTWLSIENLAGWRKDSTSCFCLILSPLRKTNCVYCFPVQRNCPFPFCFNLAISWVLYHLNSTTLPIFRQLNLPHFLAIISFL